MPKVTFVKKAGKDYPQYGINKGESFYWYRQGGQEVVTRDQPMFTDTAVVALKSAEIEVVTAPVVAAKAPKAKKARSRKTKGSPVTENEMELLKAIGESEYNSGDPLAQVWTECVWGFEGNKKFGGTLASLVKKGFATAVTNLGKENVCALTMAGLEILDPERAAKVRAEKEQVEASE
jgi:hypothetical protein